MNQNLFCKQLILLFVTFVIIQNSYSQSGTHSEQEANNKDITFVNDSVKVNRYVKFSTELFKLNLEEPAVGVQFYKNGIIYLLDTKKFYKKVRASFGILDTYYSQIKQKNLGRPSYFTNQFAFPYPTESTSFTSDFSTIYFTKISGFSNSGHDNIKIFEAKYNSARKLSNSDWSDNFIELPFNGENYSCVQPSISGDGNIMIFASDMPGGFGNFDLYIVRKEDDIWTDPVNLGRNVNTEGNENFPSLIEPGTIYFASDGHNGFGDYDIYYTKYQKGNWTNAINLGEPVNSSGTEIAFTVSRDDNGMAFFSSNRNLYKKKFQVFLAILKTGKPFLVGENIMETGKEFETIVADNTEKNEKLDKEVSSPAQVPQIKEDKIEFRIQLSSSRKSLSGSNVKIGDKNYPVGEYYYKSAYRQTVGNFKEFSSASQFQKKCKNSGYSQAFVVAFKNNERTLDKSVFAQKTAPVAQYQSKAPTVNVVAVKNKAAGVSNSDNKINYRIQILSSQISKGNFNVVIDGKEYPSFEYNYQGLYRYTIGRFNTVSEALKFHSKCKNTKYNQAFIVKFKGNNRVLK